MSVRLQTQKLLLLSLLSSVWASWATWIPIKPFAAYKLEWRCFLEYGILNFRLQIQEHTRFPGQEENMPSSAFPVCCPQTILRMMQASWVVPLEGSYEQYVSWDVIVFERKNTTLIISWITFNDRSFRKCIIIVCFALKKVISKLLGRACSACSK